MADIEIHTDGSTLGGTGPGGWAAILEQGGYRRTIAGLGFNTTINEMEIRAIYESMAFLRDTPRSRHVAIMSDSRVALGWVDGTYSRSGYTYAGYYGKLIDRVMQRSPHQFSFRWIPSKSCEGNRTADQLAKFSRDQSIQLCTGNLLDGDLAWMAQHCICSSSIWYLLLDKVIPSLAPNAGHGLSPSLFEAVRELVLPYLSQPLSTPTARPWLAVDLTQLASQGVKPIVPSIDQITTEEV